MHSTRSVQYSPAVFPNSSFSATQFQAAKDTMSCGISEFRCGVNEICTLLGFYTG